MKKLSALGISVATYFSLAVPASAIVFKSVDACPPSLGGFRKLCSQLEIGNLLGGLIQIAFIIAVVIALAFLIFGGIKWITSGGDKTGVEAARNTIVAALVGLVVVFLSYFILNILLKIFTGASISGLQLPTVF
ncbi:MAG: hypothetical protein US51_C0028G0006 [Microgenomates group bacterium GW2011_GWA2_37_6]|nr:MAG: hypothetical protein US51_C0028G0006 [Microgenomates group bacterium GW2011_GWA2_37_6]